VDTTTEILFNCLQEDLKAGFISSDDYLKVVRKRARKDNPRPIIDYYYSDNHPEVKVERRKVSTVLKELMTENMSVG
jgi:hypothetical protein